MLLFVTLDGLLAVFIFIGLIGLVNLFIIGHYLRKKGWSLALFLLLIFYLITAVILWSLADFTYLGSFEVMAMIWTGGLLPVAFLVLSLASPKWEIYLVLTLLLPLMWTCYSNYRVKNDILFYADTMNKSSDRFNIHYWLGKEVNKDGWEEVLRLKGPFFLKEAVEICLDSYRYEDAGSLLETNFGKVVFFSWADYNAENPEYPLSVGEDIDGIYAMERESIVRAATHPELFVHWAALADEDPRQFRLMSMFWEQVLQNVRGGSELGEDHMDLPDLRPGVVKAVQYFENPLLKKMAYQADSVAGVNAKMETGY